MSSWNGSTSSTKTTRQYTQSELLQRSYKRQNYISPYGYSNLSGKLSQSGVSLYKSNNAKRKEKELAKRTQEKNYKIYEQKSTNGWKTFKIYYVNGIRTDAFGRKQTDVGFSGFGKDPVYPKSEPFIPLKAKKNKKYQELGVSGLDASTNLEFDKMDTHIRYTNDVINKINKIKQQANKLLLEEGELNVSTAILGDAHSIKESDLFATLYNKSFSVDVNVEEVANTEEIVDTIIENSGSIQVQNIADIVNTNKQKKIDDANAQEKEDKTSAPEEIQTTEEVEATISTLTDELSIIIEVIADYEHQIEVLDSNIAEWNSKIDNENTKTSPNIIKINAWNSSINSAKSAKAPLNTLRITATITMQQINENIETQQELLETIENNNNNINNTTTTTDKKTTDIKTADNKTKDEIDNTTDVVRQKLSHITKQNQTVRSFKILNQKGKSVHGLTNFIYYPPTLYNSRTPYNLYKPKSTFTNRNTKVL